MSTSPPVLVSKQEQVAVITLNRPDNANTLDIPTGRALLEAAIDCERDTAVRAIVLTGAGKNFCFGGDLRGMVAAGSSREGYLRELTSYLHGAISHFVRMDAPVIAAINGTAAGAGIGLALMADLAIAAQSAKFSLAYTGVALTPDGSTSFFLPRMVGPRRAAELILTNRNLSAQEACDWGMINQVVATDKVLDEAKALATRLAAGPIRAYGKSKRLLAASSGALEAHMALESQMIARQASTSEGHEGIGAFLEKRQPKFN
ncbi:MAG: enoyl-CoA hydratase-related protein [Steroidobacteraceae bacterium]